MTEYGSLKSILQKGGKAHPFWILGPCVLETSETVNQIAETICQIRDDHKLNIVFKASFDKANRTSIHSKRGPGLEEGLKTLSHIKSQYKLPILTDVHDVSQVSAAAEVADILQVPAFLSRQTDLLVAVAQSGRPVNVKKGQFLSPENVRQIGEKLIQNGCQDYWITERGVSFGYGKLIVDFSGFHIMENLGADIIFDCTHSVQAPAIETSTTGGIREAIPDLARGAAAVGVKGFFGETHPHPEDAWSDASNAWPLPRLEELVLQTMQVAFAAHGD